MTPSTEELMQEHAPLVRRLALRFASKLPASVELDDLIQSGMIGLLDAARRYQKERGAQFTTYAITRVNGAMLDELRRQDWLPRNARTRARQIEVAIQAVEHEMGRRATDTEIADHLGLTAEGFHDLLDEAQGIQLVHYEDMVSGEQDSDMRDSTILESIPCDEASPLDMLLNSQFRQCLVDAISSLPEKERLVLSLSYEQDLNFSEIGEVLNVSRGRVSQIRTQAIIRLRAKLQAMSWDSMPGTKDIVLADSIA